MQLVSSWTLDGFWFTFVSSPMVVPLLEVTPFAWQAPANKLMSSAVKKTILYSEQGFRIHAVLVVIWSVGSLAILTG